MYITLVCDHHIVDYHVSSSLHQFQSPQLSLCCVFDGLFPATYNSKKGGGWNIEYQQCYTTSDYVWTTVFFPFVNGSNDPCSSAPFLVLTTRKRGVRERPSSKASFTKSRLIVFSSETHIDSFLVTLVYQRIELGVLPPLNVLKLGNGDLGHWGCSTIAWFVEPLQLDNGGW
jgi:hypothetical protein